jgi:hypothetical protein
MYRESLPNPKYYPPIGAYFLSAGRTFMWRCTSSPICKLYWNGDRHEPWATESAWYQHADPNKGWVKSGPNYPSVMAIGIEVQPLLLANESDILVPQEYGETTVTLRHMPKWSYEISDLLPIIREALVECEKNIFRPFPVQLTAAVIQRMSSM